MHSEFFTISKETAEIINCAKLNKKRIIAVGTTSLRALEASCDNNGQLKGAKFGLNQFLLKTPMIKLELLEKWNTPIN